ncbi:phosphoenolpyruvate carboxylase [Alkalicoccus daliensis]|uniref:Phosphoenolpyruvate carboxylase n=1 Tax=Alkalicoccus daliensis TaxID=745820 RepID=A0A1H0J4B1_9BACI|nr:phosphoenolpyruvate carboxylase [Alkalicoccus daliensis]SDO38618.1 Phosphoenolpyruvate carboxylase, type 1 [Alkalicoccus daliensis]
MTETQDQNVQLRSDVKKLGSILGEVLKKHGGEELFQKVEDIRELTKGLRDNYDAAKYTQLKDEISKLESPMRQQVIRAFAIYFHLVNIAEQNHRIRRSQFYRLDRDSDVQKHSIQEAILALKADKHSEEKIQEIIDDLSIELIMTAHPTEATKRTVLEIQKRISTILQKLDHPMLPYKKRRNLEESLINEVTVLWQTDELRHRKPTVLDEVKNGLYYFDQTLFDVLPAVHQELEDQLNDYYPDKTWKVPNFLNFGSWIGGDRDGNPFVTPEVTWETLKLQRGLALRKYDEALTDLMKRFSQSTTRVSISPEFVTHVEEQERKYLTGKEKWQVEGEVFRRMFAVILKRLRQVEAKSKHAYDHAEELLRDLMMIEDTAKAHQLEGTKLKKLNKVIRQVRLFGFHLATLDVRNHSGEHQIAVSEMLKVVGIEEDYASLEEEKKQEVLEKVLKDPRPLMLLNEDYSKETQEIFEVFKMIQKAHKEFGRRSIEVYLISMTQSASDLLEVLVLAKEAGIYRLHVDGTVESNLNVAPLLETVDDLIAGPKIMQTLFDMDLYRSHIKERGEHQEIMLGYSDGSKDGGTLTANWKLFKAQQEIHNMARDYNIGLKFFHGRGGSLGRGGGPLNNSIMSQPAETLGDGVKITEQGEVLSSRYMLGDIAFRNLEQAASALIQSTSKVHHEQEKVTGLKPEWENAIEKISAYSLKKYQSLVFGDPDFLTYFKQTTPLNELRELNIGSRPMSRKGSEKFEDLRAIPWVFAWTQCRQMIPAWYASGSGFANLVEEDEKHMDTLKEMYLEWPFFRSTVNNLQMALMKADLMTAKEYVNLVEDKEIGERIFGDISAEYDRTRKFLLEISGAKELLDFSPNIQESVYRRNPYVDPMNFLQVDLIQKLRATGEDEHTEELLTEVLLTISGVAAGLLNTG